MAAKTIEECIALLKMERDSILQQLANDALSGLEPDHSFEGHGVSNVAFRESLYRRLEGINVLLNQYEPFSFTGVMY